jgi:hypothetical protein
MQTNITNTQRPISGSKPRKNITKINYDNPSLYFYFNIGSRIQLQHYSNIQ